MRTVISLLGLVLALAVSTPDASAQSAPTPLVAGTLRAPSTNAAWGTWEAFETSSNVFGFWMRFRPSNQHVITVVPFEMTADGQLHCWYIEYWLVGAVDPNRTEGWQWKELRGGRILLNPATATSSSIDGTMTQTYQLVGYSRQAETQLRPSPIRLTLP